VPDATLFLLLEARRLTETDLADCAKMVEWARGQGRPIDVERLRSDRGTARETAAGERRVRLGRLLDLLA
jgi:hypothetical protein